MSLRFIKHEVLASRLGAHALTDSCIAVLGQVVDAIITQKAGTQGKPISRQYTSNNRVAKNRNFIAIERQYSLRELSVERVGILDRTLFKGVNKQ